MSDTIVVYRIDRLTNSAEGPFVYASLCLNEVANMLDCQDPNDMPVMDFTQTWVFCDKEHRRCGFTTLNELLWWFDHPMRKWLKNDGFCLSIYKTLLSKVFVPNDHTTNQCWFNPLLAQRKVFSLDEAEELLCLIS